jgi:hypothetical protein
MSIALSDPRVRLIHCPRALPRPSLLARLLWRSKKQRKDDPTTLQLSVIVDGDQGSAHTDVENERLLDGIVVALPPCSCGAQQFLKADYKLKDDFLRGQMLLHFVDEEGIWLGCAMKLSHACNLRLLHMLHTLGKLPVPPPVPVLPFEAIDASPLASFPIEIVDSFWLPYALFGLSITSGGIHEQVARLAEAHHVVPLHPLPVSALLALEAQASLHSFPLAFPLLEERTTV